jgi:hypothetical protein
MVEQKIQIWVDISMASRYLLCLMVFLAAATFLFVGTEDAEEWLRWADNVNQHGLIAGYQLNAHEHPPLLSLLFLLATNAGEFFGLHTYYGLKLGLLLFLSASTVIIYYWSERKLEFTFYCYLSLLLSSLCLSYIDILFCPFILLAFYFISKEKIAFGVFFFTAATFIKYPPIIIAPFLAFYLIHLKLQKQYSSNFLIRQFLVDLLLPVMLIVIPVFVFFGMEPVYALQRAFEHSILSAQAFNFNWIVTRFIQIFPGMEFSPQGWELNDRYIWLKTEWSFVLLRITVSVFYLSLFAAFLSKPKNIESLLLFCIAGHMTYFVFNHGVHENHLFLSCILAIALACINPQFKPMAITVSFISSVNLIAFYGFNGNPIHIWPDWYLKTCVVTSESPLNAICNLSNAYRPYFDLKLLLAFFNVFYYFRLWTHLVIKRDAGIFV